MKQHIEPYDLEELPPKALKRLVKWWQPARGDVVFDREFGLTLCVNGDGEFEDEGTTWAVDKKTCLPLLSIGRLFQFLEEHDRIPFDDEAEGGPEKLIWWSKDLELCDVLWENTVETLEGQS